jgi:hypothetical protein
MCRSKIGEEAVFKNSAANRAAAMAKCMAAPKKPGAMLTATPAPQSMDVDNDAPVATARVGRSYSRGRGAPRAPELQGNDDDMEGSEPEAAKSVLGPNQYRYNPAVQSCANWHLPMLPCCLSSSGVHSPGLPLPLPLPCLPHSLVRPSRAARLLDRCSQYIGEWLRGRGLASLLASPLASLPCGFSCS